MGARRLLLVWLGALAATLALAGAAVAAVHVDRTYGHGGVAKPPPASRRPLGLAAVRFAFGG